MQATRTIVRPARRPRPMNKTRVQARIRDWTRRLNALYATMDQWLEADAPDAEVVRGTRPQIVEEVMKAFHVRAGTLPTYGIIHGQKRIDFVPSDIWIIRANGRVDVFAGSHFHTLVDTGDESGADWNLVLPSDRRPLRAFDRAAFRGLLKEGR